MATPTANYGFIKDAPTQLYDVAVVNANLDAIDAVLKEHADANSAAHTALTNSINAVNTALDARLDVLEGRFTKDVAAAVTNAFTAASGWTINEQRLWAWGPIVQVKIDMIRTGATIATANNGNITNVTFATWAAGGANYHPLSSQEMGFAPSDAGIMWGGILTNTALQIVSMPPKTDDFPGLTTGSTIRGTVVYFRNMP